MSGARHNKKRIFSLAKSNELKKQFMVCIAIEDEQHYKEIVELIDRPGITIVGHGSLRQVGNRLQHLRYRDEEYYAKKRAKYHANKDEINRKRRERYKKNNKKLKAKRRKTYKKKREAEGRKVRARGSMSTRPFGKEKAA